MQRKAWYSKASNNREVCWQKSYAADCKSVDSGASPEQTSKAQVVKLVDTRDLKSLGLNIRAGSTPALGTTK